MTTRLYLSSHAHGYDTLAVGTHIPVSSLWTSSGSASKYCMGKASQLPLDSAETTKAVAETSGLPGNILLAQYVSNGLAAQTISGTVKGQIKCNENNADADMGLHFSLRLYSKRGTARGTLYESATQGNEFALTTPTNRYAPPGGSQSLTSQDAQLGDVLVCEIGYRHTNATVSSRTGTITHGYSSARSDLPEDETDTGALNAWIELSQTLTFAEDIELLEQEILDIDLVLHPVEGQLWPRGNRGV